MAFSQEIRFKIGGDTSSLEGSFRKAEGVAAAAGRRMETSLSRGMRGKAGQDLVAFRRRQAYEEADTAGKIKITQERLASLAYQRAKAEDNTTKALRIQLQMEKEKANLRQLQKQQAGETTGPEPTGGINWASMLSRFGMAAGTALVASVVTYFSRAANRAQQTEKVTEGGLTGLMGTLATIGGARGQLRQGEKAEAQAGVDEQIQMRLYKGLTEGPYAAVQNLINPEWMRMVDEANEKVLEARRRGADIHQQNILTRREIEKQNQEYSFQINLLNQTNRLKMRGASEVEITQMQENLRAQRIADIEGRNRSSLQGRGETGSNIYTPEELRAMKLQVQQDVNQINIQRRELMNREQAANQTLTEQAAGGRTFRNGAARPRSETERLAQRAMQFRDTANQLALTGASAGAGAYITRARSLEKTVAQRLAEGTMDITAPKGTADLSALPAKIDQSNTLLSAIASALAATDVGNVK